MKRKIVRILMHNVGNAVNEISLAEAMFIGGMLVAICALALMRVGGLS